MDIALMVGITSAYVHEHLKLFLLHITFSSRTRKEIEINDFINSMPISIYIVYYRTLLVYS